MDLRSKIKNEDCAEELEELIIDHVKAGFESDEELVTECKEYIEDFYCEEFDQEEFDQEEFDQEEFDQEEGDHEERDRMKCDAVTKEDLLEIIRAYRKKFQNTGNQENFLKLDAAFQALKKQGIVALHYAGYTQSDGFADCNEVAAWLEEEGEKLAGCCFYTEQSLEHILHGDTDLLYLSFGNYEESPTAEEVGQKIVEELKAVGFEIQWDGTAKTTIAIQNFQWDKYYTDGEEEDDKF